MQFTVELNEADKPIPKTLRQLLEESFDENTKNFIRDNLSIGGQIYNVFVIFTGGSSLKMQLLINAMMTDPIINEETGEEIEPASQIWSTEQTGLDLTNAALTKTGFTFKVRSLDLVEFAGAGTFECAIW